LVKEYGTLLPPDGQLLLEYVVSNARRMTQLIDDLLRLSQLGRQRLSKQPVSLANLVGTVFAELRPEQAERQIHVQVGNLPDCVADASLLKQVFVNLLSNAFKFTRHKPDAQVEVGCRQEDRERIYFVRDNGAGFEMRYADRLFGVFQRLHSEREFEGTGVGLSIVQRIIQRHGGRIWAEAEVDKGATFYFTLSE
jgi:light-regulated signal transduction histidine kinase (bacteriophytochrome)